MEETATHDIHPSLIQYFSHIVRANKILRSGTDLLLVINHGCVVGTSTFILISFKTNKICKKK